MAKTVHVYGYEEYKAAAKDSKDKTVFVLFSGTAGDDGKSWCPDCVKADPVVMSCLSDLPSDSVFIHCGVGDRAFWKDQNNSFRKDSDLKLKSVPTLLKLGEPHRLEEEQCANADLVKMMFKDD